MTLLFSCFGMGKNKNQFVVLFCLIFQYIPNALPFLTLMYIKSWIKRKRKEEREKASILFQAYNRNNLVGCQAHYKNSQYSFPPSSHAFLGLCFPFSVFT